MRLIDADRLSEHQFTRESAKSSDYMRGWNDAIDAIVDNALTIELDESIIQSVLNKRCMTAVSNEYLISLHGKRPQGEWIPVKYRPMTGEERIEFAEYYGIEYCDTVDEKVFSSPLPEDGQEILVSHETFVTEDICEWDEYGCGLENNGDWDGITAWMPKPEPYKEEEI